MHPCYDNLENKKNARKRYSPPAVPHRAALAGSLRLHRRVPCCFQRGAMRWFPPALPLNCQKGRLASYLPAAARHQARNCACQRRCVIDSDYTGEVCVGLINQFDEPYQIQPVNGLHSLPFCHPLPRHRGGGYPYTNTAGSGGLWLHRPISSKRVMCPILITLYEHLFYHIGFILIFHSIGDGL